MPTDVAAIGVIFAGLRFASWAELVFVLAMLAPLAFFGCCALYLWRLLLRALPARNRVAENTEGGRRKAEGSEGDAARSVQHGARSPEPRDPNPGLRAEKPRFV